MRVRYRHTVLALAFVAFFATMTARLAVSPLIPAIIEEFSTSKGAVGLALTGMWAAYAVMQFPSGVLAERLGERRVILAALGLTAVGSLLMALSPSFLVLAVFVLFMGAGAGLYFPAAASYLTRTFERTGRALGFPTAGGPAGGLVAPVVAAYVGVRYGWRAGVALGAAVALPVFVLFYWRVRPTEPERPDLRVRDRFQASALVELLSRPPVAYTTFIAGSTTFAWQAAASFFPTFLIEYHGFGTQRAGLVLGVVFALSVVGLPILGSLSDRFGRDAVLAAAIAGAAVGLALFLYSSALPVVAAATLVTGIGISWGGAIQSRYMDNFDPAERGAGFGLVRSAYVLIGAPGSAVVGGVADAAGWVAAIGVLVGLLALVALTLVLNRALRLGL